MSTEVTDGMILIGLVHLLLLPYTLLHVHVCLKQEDARTMRTSGAMRAEPAKP